MQSHARVVIIGAGIVGCSTAYYLTKLGWRDIVVVDQGPLYFNWGSTSHAPGMMFQHNPSKTVCQLAQLARQTYASLQPKGGKAYYDVGSLELASTPERWEELKRRVGQCASWGLEARLIGPDEIHQMIPMMRTGGLLGAFYVPSDCVIRASAVTEALAEEAQTHGAAFYGDTPATGINVKDGHVTGVVTPNGTIQTEIVVSAAGIWGPLIGRMAGVTIPLTPMQHIFARTAPINEFKGETEWVRQPIVRHQDKDLYFRQWDTGYSLGSYRHDPLPVDPEQLPTPAMSTFTPEHFAQSLEDTYDLFPTLRGVELTNKFNGLFSFTADGNSILGESPDVRGFWSAEAVWITHAGGVGKVMAEWISEGVPSLDLREADINRFHPYQLSPRYVRERSNQNYVEVYDVIHPLQQVESPRNLRRSPFHERFEELGAYFFESAGWERPQWFQANEALLKSSQNWPDRAGWAARYWSPIVGAEHQATRQRVAMFDLTAFFKVEIAGPGALAYLQNLCSNQIDQSVGKVVYTSMLNERGGIYCDLTITRVAPDRFWVVTGGSLGYHDLAWLRMHQPPDGSVQIYNLSSSYSCIGLWGPRARDVIRRVSTDDYSNEAFPYFSARPVTIGYAPCFAIRVSYAGELGWEVYIPTEFGFHVWDTLWTAGKPDGIIAAGGAAFDSLRLEKGYRLWGAEIHTEYNPYEAGIGWAVRLKKGPFIGRDALVQIRAQGPYRQLCCLTLDDPTVVVMGKEPIFDRDRVLGYVTSANYGYTVGQSIVYGYLPASHVAEGTRVQVYFFGNRYPATVTREPLYDPENAAVKA